MLALLNGQRRWPLFGLHSHGKNGLSRRYQVVQKSPQSIEVTLVTARLLTAAKHPELHELWVLKSRLSVPHRLRIPRLDFREPHPASLRISLPEPVADLSYRTQMVE